MADPQHSRKLKVFLGSTVFDLLDLRSELVQGIRDWGHVPVSSEESDFPVQPGVHSHDVCLRAIRACDVYVLVISSRYGGIYAGTEHPEFEGLSITRAETRTAFALGKAVVSFVRRQVWDERPVIKKNLHDGVSIRPYHAKSLEVHEFIDEVVHQKRDNWIWPFETSIQLKTQLREALSRVEVELHDSVHSGLGLLDPDMLDTILAVLSAQYSMPFGLVTADRHRYSYPSPNSSAYGHLIRSTPGGHRLTRQLDMDAADKTMASGEPLAYQSHAGLSDFTCPVVVDGRSVAVLFTGQVRTEEVSSAASGEIRQLAKSIGLDPEQLLRLYQNTPISSQQDVMDRLVKARKAVEYFVALAQHRSFYEAASTALEPRVERSALEQSGGGDVGELEFAEWTLALTESEFAIRVAMPLIERLGYSDIRYSHSATEHGRDLVFAYHDPLGSLVYSAAEIKRPRAGRQLGAADMAALADQVIAAYRAPYTIPQTRTTTRIAQVWLITPSTVEPHAYRELAAIVERAGETAPVLLDARYLFAKVREFAPDVLLACSADLSFSPSAAGTSEGDLNEFRSLFEGTSGLVCQDNQPSHPVLDRLVTTGLLEVTYNRTERTFVLTPRGRLYLRRENPAPKGGARR